MLARYVAAGAVPFWRMVPALDVLGELLLRRGRVDSARAVLRTALDSLGRVTSYPTAQRASILGHLGETERARGDTAEARTRFDAYRAIYHVLGPPGEARASSCAPPAVSR